MSNVIHNHMIAAISIADRIPVKYVIECGVGCISTGWFLNHKWFPDLEYLLSLETQSNWIIATAKNIDDKSKWFTRIVESEYEMGNINSSVDIVLVDSFSILGRIQILEQLCKRDKIKFIILHDCQYTVYNPIIDKFKYSYLFSDTGIPAIVLSNIVNLKEFFHD